MARPFKRRKIASRAKNDAQKRQLKYFYGVLEDPSIDKKLRLLALNQIKDMYKNSSLKQKGLIKKALQSIPEQKLQDFSIEELKGLVKQNKESKKRKRSDSFTQDKESPKRRKEEAPSSPVTEKEEAETKEQEIKITTKDMPLSPDVETINAEEKVKKESQSVKPDIFNTVSSDTSNMADGPPENSSSDAEAKTQLEIKKLTEKVKTKKGVLRFRFEELKNTEKTFHAQIEAFASIDPVKLKAHYIYHLQRKKKKEKLSTDESHQLKVLLSTLTRAEAQQLDSITLDLDANESKNAIDNSEESKKLKNKIKTIEGKEEKSPEDYENIKLHKARIKELNKRKPMSTLTNFDDIMALSTLYGQMREKHQALLTAFEPTGPDDLGDPTRWATAFAELEDIHGKVAMQFHKMNAENAELPPGFTAQFNQDHPTKEWDEPDPNDETGKRVNHKKLAMDPASCMMAFIQRSMRYPGLAEAYSGACKDLIDKQEMLSNAQKEAGLDVTPAQVPKAKLETLRNSSKSFFSSSMTAALKNKDARRHIDNAKLTENINQYILILPKKKSSRKNQKILESLVKDYLYAKNDMIKFEDELKIWKESNKAGDEPKVEQIIGDKCQRYEKDTEFQTEVLDQLTDKQWHKIKKSLKGQSELAVKYYEEKREKQKATQTKSTSFTQESQDSISSSTIDESMELSESYSDDGPSQLPPNSGAIDEPGKPEVQGIKPIDLPPPPLLSETNPIPIFKPGVIQKRVDNLPSLNSNPSQHQSIPVQTLSAHRELPSLGSKAPSRRPFHFTAFDKPPPLVFEEEGFTPSSNATIPDLTTPVKQETSPKAGVKQTLECNQPVNLVEMASDLTEKMNVTSFQARHKDSVSVVLSDGAMIQLNAVAGKKNRIEIAIFNTNNDAQGQAILQSVTKQLGLEPLKPNRPPPQLQRNQAPNKPVRPPVPLPRDQLPPSHMASLNKAPLPPPLSGTSIRKEVVYQKSPFQLNQDQSLDSLISQMDQMKKSDTNANGEISNFSVLRDLDGNARELIIKHKDLDSAIMITQKNGLLSVECPQKNDFDVNQFLDKLVNPKPNAKLDAPKVSTRAKHD